MPALDPQTAKTAYDLANDEGTPKGPTMGQTLTTPVRILDALIRGKNEKAMRRQFDTLNQQVRSGEGLSKGQRQGYLATLAQQRYAQLNPHMAKINRGFAGDSGAQGVAQQALMGAHRASAEAARGEASEVTKLSMAELARKTALRDSMRAEVMQMNRAQRDEVLGGVETMLTGKGPDYTFTGGIKKRETDAAAAEPELAGLDPIKYDVNADPEGYYR